MADDHSQEHHSPPVGHRREHPARHADENSGSPPAHESVPSYPASLLADLHLAGRGNGPVRQTLALQMQQTYGNRATLQLMRRRINGTVGTIVTSDTDAIQRTAIPSAVVIQRDVVDDAAKRLADKPGKASIDAVRKYKKNSKKTSLTAWKRVLESVKTEETFWNEKRDHIMLGDDATPPKGFHSKQALAAAHAEAVGTKEPANAGNRAAYKQWTRNKRDRTVNSLKISTFYPDGWPEDKIRAAVLLRNAGAGHDVESTFGLVANEGTVYPNTNLENPDKPAG
jgi:hypothetical protein